MYIANLSCGHTKEVNDQCSVGTVTSCDECEPPEGAPGVNSEIISVFEIEEEDDEP